MNIGLASVAFSVLLVSSGCARTRNPVVVPPNGTRVVHKRGVVIYSSAHPSRQRVEDISSVWFQVPLPQELSGVLRDPQSVSIRNLKLELTCAGSKKEVATDDDGKFSFGRIQPDECTISLGPGPWVAPTIECSTESCSVRPTLSIRRALMTIEIKE
jgi:hypothetical protein